MRAQTILVLGLGIAIGIGFALAFYYRRYATQSMPAGMVNEEIIERDEKGRIVRIHRKVKYE